MDKKIKKKLVKTLKMQGKTYSEIGVILKKQKEGERNEKKYDSSSGTTSA